MVLKVEDNKTKIRLALSDGRKRFASELATETGLTVKQVNCSIEALTSLEPRLAEADNGAFFLVAGR